MEYHGRLFGKIGSRYFDTGRTSSEFDSMQNRIVKLELSLEKFLNGETLESRKSLIDLFAPRLEKIFEDKYPTKAQIYDALHKSISDLERT